MYSIFRLLGPSAVRAKPNKPITQLINGKRMLSGRRNRRRDGPLTSKVVHCLVRDDIYRINRSNRSASRRFSHRALPPAFAASSTINLRSARTRVRCRHDPCHPKPNFVRNSGSERRGRVCRSLLVKTKNYSKIDTGPNSSAAETHYIYIYYSMYTSVKNRREERGTARWGGPL